MAGKEEKKGILSRLFGKGKSGCCGFQIQEVSEVEDLSKSVVRKDSSGTVTGQASANTGGDE